MSAKIGNGTSTYEQGNISATNELAKKLGITVGMTAKEAADRMLKDTTHKVNWSARDQRDASVKPGNAINIDWR
ncbi:MAG: hypothetical protein CL874_00625 [Dehalococcoidales bacterium]|jgi:hypothetical protein|nr:hypothetical protein [Dehalococcoidales bacterium]MDP6449123.1 hypothetical protein [Dehalococcoidales bacterium]MDP6576208.1 hypothetical protein [Dehalococcoidales bacterium]MDP6825261.1 hypothetical protein [Dehalococcoidales bacterium]|tara:strand:- start:703 stop:924 length:222 start_codon:yes stop_codon:yes gene_type:complete